MTAAQSLTVEAAPPSQPGFSLRRVLRLVLTRGSAELGPEHYPSVVAVNSKGQTFKLFEASNWEEAVTKRDRLRQELASLDEAVWCDQYVVPGAFVRGDWPPKA